jgi:hypothetical protein
VSASEIAWKIWGCFFNSTQAVFPTIVGDPYAISANIYNTMTTNNTFNNTAATSGMKIQSVMNINLTVASTIVYLNFSSNFTNVGVSNTVNAYSSIMVTRIA